MAPLFDNSNHSLKSSDEYTIEIEEETQDAIRSSSSHGLDNNDSISSPLSSSLTIGQQPPASSESNNNSNTVATTDADANAENKTTTATTQAAASAAPTSPIAAAIEQEQKQRQTLVEQMIRLLFLALEKKKTRDHNPSERQNELIQTILAEEAGSTDLTATPRADITVSSGNRSMATTTRTIWNRGKPLKLYWMWQKPSSSSSKEGSIRHSYCKLGISAEKGVKVEFFPPTSLVSALLNAENDDGDDDLSVRSSMTQHNTTTPTAVCEISNFEWRLKGSTKHSYVTIDFEADNAGNSNSDNNEDASDNHKRTEDYIVRSSWKFDRVGFSMVNHSFGFATEEVLVEARDIALRGNIVIDSEQLHKTAEENAVEVATTTKPSIELQCKKSGLSLNVLDGSGCFEGSSPDERHKASLLLRTLVDSLDQLLAVPNLQLTVGTISDEHDGDNDYDDPIYGPREEDKEHSFHPKGLGDALQHLVERFCNDDAGLEQQQRHSERVLELREQSPQLFSSSKAFGAMASRAARKAKEGKARFLEKQKEQQEQMKAVARGLFVVEAEGNTGNGNAATRFLEKQKEQRQQFGNRARGLFGRRKKRMN